MPQSKKLCKHCGKVVKLNRRQKMKYHLDSTGNFKCPGVGVYYSDPSRR